MKWNFKNWFQKYKLHLLIWAIFIFYETVIVGLFFGVFGHPITYISHYIAILFLFYIHADVLFPWALKKKNATLWRLPVVFFLEITVFIIVSYLIDKLLIISDIIEDSQKFNITFLYFLKLLYRCVYFIGAATGYYYLSTYIKERRKTAELEKQHLNDIINNQKAEQELTKAQNAFLKAQINPHFLFNTLDFIYHNIDESSPVAADAVIILTEMMRYAVDADKMGDYIRLGDEIEQAENLIYLNQMRKNHTLALKLNYTDEVRQIKLIPLVVLTLVENIFKHGNLNDPNLEAIIDIYNESDVFHISTFNFIDYKSPKNGSHSGLNNIEKRLRFAYGANVEFKYETDLDNRFSLHLSIPIKSLTGHVWLQVS